MSTVCPFLIQFEIGDIVNAGHHQASLDGNLQLCLMGKNFAKTENVMNEAILPSFGGEVVFWMSEDFDALDRVMIGHTVEEMPDLLIQIRELQVVDVIGGIQYSFPKGRWIRKDEDDIAILKMEPIVTQSAPLRTDPLVTAHSERNNAQKAVNEMIFQNRMQSELYPIRASSESLAFRKFMEIRLYFHEVAGIDVALEDYFGDAEKDVWTCMVVFSCRKDKVYDLRGVIVPNLQACIKRMLERHSYVQLYGSTCKIQCYLSALLSNGRGRKFLVQSRELLATASIQALVKRSLVVTRMEARILAVHCIEVGTGRALRESHQRLELRNKLISCKEEIRKGWLSQQALVDLLGKSTIQTWEPVALAAVLGNTNEIRQLHSLGQDLDAAAFCSFDYPLHCAALTGQFQSCKVLLELGANPLKQSKAEGINAIHSAVLGKDLETLQLLLQSIPKSKINEKTNLGDTALHIACADGNVLIAKLLLDYGADTRTVPPKKYHPAFDTMINWFPQRDIVAFLCAAASRAVLSRGYTDLCQSLRVASIHVQKNIRRSNCRNVLAKQRSSVCILQSCVRRYGEIQRTSFLRFPPPPLEIVVTLQCCFRKKWSRNRLRDEKLGQPATTIQCATRRWIAKKVLHKEKKNKTSSSLPRNRYNLPSKASDDAQNVQTPKHQPDNELQQQQQQYDLQQIRKTNLIAAAKVACIIIQCSYRCHQSRRIFRDLAKMVCDAAILVIQSWGRAVLQRLSYLHTRAQYRIPAIKIQQYVRIMLAKKALVRQRQHRAAIVIQCPCKRFYCSRKVKRIAAIRGIQCHVRRILAMAGFYSYLLRAKFLDRDKQYNWLDHIDRPSFKIPRVLMQQYANNNASNPIRGNSNNNSKRFSESDLNDLYDLLEEEELEQEEEEALARENEKNNSSADTHRRKADAGTSSSRVRSKLFAIKTGMTGPELIDKWLSILAREGYPGVRRIPVPDRFRPIHVDLRSEEEKQKSKKAEMIAAQLQYHQQQQRQQQRSPKSPLAVPRRKLRGSPPTKRKNVSSPPRMLKVRPISAPRSPRSSCFRAASPLERLNQSLKCNCQWPQTCRLCASPLRTTWSANGKIVSREFRAMDTRAAIMAMDNDEDELFNIAVSPPQNVDRKR